MNATPLDPLSQSLLADRLVALHPWDVCYELPLQETLERLGAGLEQLEGEVRTTAVRRILRGFAAFIRDRDTDDAPRFAIEVALLRAVAREELSYHAGPHGPLALIARVFATLRVERERERQVRRVALRRESRGATPIQRRNARVKFAESENPSR